MILATHRPPLQSTQATLGTEETGSFILPPHVKAGVVVVAAFVCLLALMLGVAMAVLVLPVEGRREAVAGADLHREVVRGRSLLHLSCVILGPREDAGTQVGGMGFDAHTVRTATVLSNSSSGVGSGAGAGAGRSRAGTGMGGRERGGGGDDGMLHVSSRPMFSSFGSGDWNVDDILLQNMISKVDRLFHRHPA